MVPINCLRILASSTVVFRCPRFQTAPHREHCLRYNRPIKQLHVAFAWRASYYCLVTTKLQSNRFSKSSQYNILRNSVKRHPSCVDGRTDMTKLIVVFRNAVAKAPEIDLPLFCSKQEDKIFEMPRQQLSKNVICTCLGHRQPTKRDTILRASVRAHSCLWHRNISAF